MSDNDQILYTRTTDPWVWPDRDLPPIRALMLESDPLLGRTKGHHPIPQKIGSEEPSRGCSWGTGVAHHWEGLQCGQASGQGCLRRQQARSGFADNQPQTTALPLDSNPLQRAFGGLGDRVERHHQSTLRMGCLEPFWW